jgi:hypothetical protein
MTDRSSWAVPILGLLLCAYSAAQDVESKQATMAKPKEVDSLFSPMKATALIPPPNHEAFFNRKQQRIGEHHRPIPINGRPAKLNNPKVPHAAATSVNNPLAGGASTVELIVNHALTAGETNSLTSNVGEPTVAVRGMEILFTGNWFAAFSKNAGGSFTYINPANAFPASSQGDFCCDQVAFYDKKHDLMIWLLQYMRDGHGNTLRLAVAHKDDIANQKWRYYDFTPKGVGNWDNEWLDFPDLAVTECFLYVTSNLFSTADKEPFKRAVLLRLPLDKLAAYDGFDYRYFMCEDLGGLRPTQGGGDTIYFGSHLDYATVRLHTWKETNTKIHMDGVPVEAWSESACSAPGPDGRDWLGRADGRITAAWTTTDTIGFAWTAAKDDDYPYPHIRVAIVDKKSKQVIAHPHLWSSDFAYAYPAVSPNADGQIGISLHFGGNTHYPSHAVGKLLKTNKWDLVTTAPGKYGPADGKWGDYQSVRMNGADPKQWVATGFAMKTGPLRTDVEVHYIHFK